MARRRLAGDELTVEPGRAGRRHLRIERQVRSRHERLPHLPLRVRPGSELDDGPGPRVAGQLHVAEPQMMRAPIGAIDRSEEHTSELQSLMRISYAVFCL